MAGEVCAGCGATLQTEFPNQPGYAPAGALERPNPVCRRCFRISHYGEFTPVELPEASYQAVVREALAQADQIVYVLDVFDINGSLVPNLAALLANRAVHLAVNKVDVLPAEVEPEALRQWIRRVVESAGVKVADVWFVSAATGSGIGELMDGLAHGDGTRVCVVGMANVGKSTLLNQLIRRSGPDAKPQFTTSRMPGTTLGMTRAKIVLQGGRTLTLMDTPGLIEGHRVTDFLCADCLKATVPATRLRPRVYQLDSGQTLFLGGFARLDFESGAHQPVVCYVSNDLVVHRTKLERADAFWESHQDDLLQVPCAACRARLGPLQPHRVWSDRARVNPGQRTADGLRIGRAGGDIVLPGLGWITLFGAAFAGRLYVPDGVVARVRPRLIGHVSRMDK